ncbi:MAG: YARHG domain-containing protein [Bauldia sp.]|nr:YARHG domain-containing protein [Bauldia sp.]
MSTTRSAARAAALSAALFLGATPTFAGCFELIGCTDSEYFSDAQLRRLSCDALWTVRNTIFDENGYCFQTAKGQAVFSNAGCKYTVSGSVPLNKYERANVERIKSVEARKGC